MLVFRTASSRGMIVAFALGLLAVTMAFPGHAAARTVEVLNIDSPWRAHYGREAAIGPWMRLDYDDREWLRHHGPFFPGIPAPGGHGNREEYFAGERLLQHLQSRGRFIVARPDEVERLTLSLSYRGGVVVYLNGQEVVRDHLPDGPLTDDSLLPTPYTVRHTDPEPVNAETARQATEARLRHVREVQLPVRLLRPGVNVVAVHIRAAPLALGPDESGRHLHAFRYRTWWATLGLQQFSLKAEAASDAAIQPNTERPPGVQVWTALPIEDVGGMVRYACPAELAGGVAPIRLIGGRNMTISGQAVVSAAHPVEAVRATIGDFVGEDGKLDLPADAVRIRYAATATEQMIEMEYAHPKPDALLPLPTGREPVQPVWVTVRVPAGTPPGLYRATLTVRADGLDRPAEVPVELTVHAWDCPDPHDWRSMVSMVQSPSSVAWAYEVEMWSQRHLELLRPSLRMMGKLGNNVVHINILNPSFFGNEHGTIAFDREGDRLVPDFTWFDRFLDLYAKEAGAPRRLILVVWEPTGGDRPTVSVRGEDGGLEHVEAAYRDHPEMWKALLDGARRRVAERSWDERALMIGIGYDARPSADTVRFFAEIAPWALWTLFTHGRGDPPVRDGQLRIGDMRVGYVEFPFSAGPGVNEPRRLASGIFRGGEWDLRSGFHLSWVEDWHDLHATWGARSILRDHSFAETFRLFPRDMVLGMSRGFSRQGIDFWPVINPDRPTLRDGAPNRRRIIAGTGAHTAGPGHTVYRHNVRSIAAPGPEGALPTVRFEMLREGLQDVEARIFLERALTDEATRTILGEELAEEVKELNLTAFNLRHYHATHHAVVSYTGAFVVAGTGWQTRLDRWYAAAALAQARLAAARTPR
ncbi:MAG: hypothetical protein JJU36_15870 [Phycisphaeraceae bacterium]|nr:hypothetical protein [Phycisphaeraceae bacterium]